MLRLRLRCPADAAFSDHLCLVGVSLTPWHASRAVSAWHTMHDHLVGFVTGIEHLRTLPTSHHAPLCSMLVNAVLGSVDLCPRTPSLLPPLLANPTDHCCRADRAGLTRAPALAKITTYSPRGIQRTRSPMKVPSNDRCSNVARHSSKKLGVCVRVMRHTLGRYHALAFRFPPFPRKSAFIFGSCHLFWLSGLWKSSRQCPTIRRDEVSHESPTMAGLPSEL